MLGRWSFSYFQGPTVKLPGSVPYVTFPQPVVSRKCLHSHEIWQVDFSPKWSRHWFFFQRMLLQTFQPGPSDFRYTPRKLNLKNTTPFPARKIIFQISKASGFLGFKMLNFCGKNKLFPHLMSPSFNRRFSKEISRWPAIGGAMVRGNTAIFFGCFTYTVDGSEIPRPTTVWMYKKW